MICCYSFCIVWCFFWSKEIALGCCASNDLWMFSIVASNDLLCIFCFTCSCCACPYCTCPCALVPLRGMGHRRCTVVDHNLLFCLLCKHFTCTWSPVLLLRSTIFFPICAILDCTDWTAQTRGCKKGCNGCASSVLLWSKQKEGCAFWLLCIASKMHNRNQRFSET